jgi:hypothetical protein
MKKEMKSLLFALGIFLALAVLGCSNNTDKSVEEAAKKNPAEAAQQPLEPLQSRSSGAGKRGTL